MARPIPDLSEISKLEDPAASPEEKTIFDRTVEKIARNRSTRNLILGTVSGWLTGVAVIKVGKVAAFGLGGGVIMLNFASEFGYIDIHWDKIKESARQSQLWIDSIMSFVRKNSCYSMGFVGGFFFGFASA